MSCPARSAFDWTVLDGPFENELAEVADDVLAAQEDERDRLREHVRDCPSCLRDAIALDPTFAFQRLPAAAPTAMDIESMRERVAGSLRLLEAEQRSAPVRESGPNERVSPVRAAVVAAIVTVAVGALALVEAPVEPGAQNAPVLAEAPAPELLEPEPTDYAHLDALPLIETIGVVHQASGKGFDVVELVDAELDLGGP